MYEVIPGCQGCTDCMTVATIGSEGILFLGNFHVGGHFLFFEDNHKLGCLKTAVFN